MTAIDTHETHGDHGHHDTPDVVDERNRLGIWLFIGGDIIVTAALLFTYFYLRGLNTDGHWMSMVGYQGHSYAYYENLANGSAGLPNPTTIIVKPLSAGLNWLVTLLTIAGAAIVWLGEKGLRTAKNAKSMASLSWLAAIVTIVAVVFSIIQLRHIPPIFVANNDSQVMAYTAYESTMMVIIGSALVHLAILAVLAVGLAVRASRGVLTGENWYHARLVRMFWVWVAVSGVITSLVTTTLNTIH